MPWGRSVPVPSVPIAPPGADGDKPHPKTLLGAGREGRMRLPEGAGVGPPVGTPFLPAPRRQCAQPPPCLSFPSSARLAEPGRGGWTDAQGTSQPLRLPQGWEGPGVPETPLTPGPAGPEKQETPNLLRQFIPGDAPRLRAPQRLPGLGEQSRHPPTHPHPPTLPARLRPDKLIALSRPREGAAAPGSERPPCLGAVGETRGQRQAASPAAPGAGPILHPGDASRRSAGAVLPGCRCWWRRLGRARRGSSPMPAG